MTWFNSGWSPIAHLPGESLLMPCPDQTVLATPIVKRLKVSILTKRTAAASRYMILKCPGMLTLRLILDTKSRSYIQ